MKLSLRYGTLVAVVAGMAALAGCTAKVTEEQLARLRELRQQEQTLMGQIRSKKDERGRLQSEMATRRAELDRCSKDREFVQSKLAQWPNVWPDWQDTPAPTNSTPRR
jgi:outer membrane murein-binding lipoprotein Lpp